MNAIVENEYIIRQLRKQQKLMDTRKLIGFRQEQMQNIDKVHKFICDTGTELK